MSKTPPKALSQDVYLLGTILGDTLKAQVGITLYKKIEQIRLLSKATFQKEGSDQLLNEALSSLTAQEILIVVRAFSHFLNLTNIAEMVHRIRRRHVVKERAADQLGSILATFEHMKENQIESQLLFDSVLKLNIDLVLTAHPTEVLRRTLMMKFDRIAHLLQMLDSKDRIHEKSRLYALLYEEITAIWLTDELRRHKPTVIDEAKWGLAVLENTLWETLPGFLRELNEALLQYTGKSLPLNASPIHFSSWIGGDRDGNPNVTAKVTQQVCYMARWVAADLYLKEINQLSASLSMTACSQALRNKVGDSPEPYRALLRDLKLKLIKTRDWLEAIINGKEISYNDVIESRDEILQPLELCYQSLIEQGGECIAQGHLTDVIRKTYCFGIGMAKLDLRQDASFHAQLCNEITQIRKESLYLSLSEEQKIRYLESAIAQPLSWFQGRASLSLQSQEVWDTFSMIGYQTQESLGYYIISMCTCASDILLVCLLQKAAGVQKILPVVPLFETLRDLEASWHILERIFSCAWYLEYIKGYQQIMIGYSDSTKDAGMLAAQWAQFRAQEQCIFVAQKYDVKLTFFHGRGGTVGRGGAPTHSAILSQPPGSVAGRLRVTEQGEVIRNKYGLAQRANRNFALYVSATLQATLTPPISPQQNWRDLMDQLAQQSYSFYTQIIKKPEFSHYFELVTPLKEIGELAMGSRPARRGSATGIEKLRAIPWIFAWTQSRLLLPAWLGVGESLASLTDTNMKKLLKDMAMQWPFFQTTLNMIEMVLSKANLEIFNLYVQRLVPEGYDSLTNSLIESYKLCQETVKETLQIPYLLTGNPALESAIQLRSIYLYPLHVLQAELLCRIRENPNIDKATHDALLISISGIAAGMQNTG